MKTLTTEALFLNKQGFTAEQLQDSTAKEITDYHNELVHYMGSVYKPVKRFATKAKAIEKTLYIQSSVEIKSIFADIATAEEANTLVEIAESVMEESKPAPTEEGEKFLADAGLQIAEKAVITDKEAYMLVAIAESEMTELNGAEPGSVDQTNTFVYTVAETKEEGGILASLVKKGLAFVVDNSQAEHEEDRLNTVVLSHAGFKAYKSIKVTQENEMKKAKPLAKKVPAKKKPTPVAKKVEEEVAKKVEEEVAKKVEEEVAKKVEEEVAEVETEEVETATAPAARKSADKSAIISALADKINSENCVSPREAKAKAVEVSIKVGSRTTVYLVPHLKDTDIVKVYLMGKAVDTIGGRVQEVADVDPKVSTTTMSWTVSEDVAIKIATQIVVE